jgi:small-conductance mechanosensitive channel
MKKIIVLLFMLVIQPCWAQEHVEPSPVAAPNSHLDTVQHEVKLLREEVAALTRALISNAQLSTTPHPPPTTQKAPPADLNNLDSALTTRSLNAISQTVETIRKYALQAVDGVILIQNMITSAAHKLQKPEDILIYAQPLSLILLIVGIGFFIAKTSAIFLEKYTHLFFETMSHTLLKFGLRTLPTLIHLGFFYFLISIIPIEDTLRIPFVTIGILFFALRFLKIINHELINPLLKASDINSQSKPLVFFRRLFNATLIVFAINLSVQAVVDVFSFPASLRSTINILSGLTILGVFIRNLIEVRQAVSNWIDSDQELSSPIMQSIQKFLKPIAPIWHHIVLILFIGNGLIFLNDNWQLALMKGALSFILLLANALAIQKRFSLAIPLKRFALKGNFGKLTVAIDNQKNAIFYLSTAISLLLSLSLIYEIWRPGALLALLSSPTFVTILSKIIILGFIFAMASGINNLGKKIVDRFVERQDQYNSQRLKSLGEIFKHFWRYIIFLPALLLALSELGFNVTPIIASISVASLGLGLASQHVFKDLFTGLFIVLEDTLAIGDIVEIGGKQGTIEELTLRMVRLRGDDGTVHTIPFGTIISISNFSKEYAYAIINFETNYTQDLDSLSQKIQDIFHHFSNDQHTKHFVKGPIEIRGVNSFGANGVEFQLRLKTPPGQQFMAKRAFMNALKKSLDAMHVVPEHIVYSVPRDIKEG